MADPAPIAIFVHRRVDHVRRLLASLHTNPEFGRSPVYVFADGARDAGEAHAVETTRSVVRAELADVELRMEERPENLGLAANIVGGVSHVLEQHDRVVVLEDDLELAPTFLDYMNRALERYAEDERVWHISGWTPPIDVQGLADAYLTRVMHCWGWGTWRSRWAHYEREPNALLARFDDARIRAFDLGDSRTFWGQVERNASGELRTWAIFWYATIFERAGLCLNPAIPQLRNVGLDGSGENCEASDRYEAPISETAVRDWPLRITEDPIALDRLSVFYGRGTNGSRLARLRRRIRRMFAGA